MNFSKIQATGKRLFTFMGPYKGDNQLITLSDLNTVYNRLNNLFPYRMYDVAFNQTGVTAPTFIKLAAGASECTSNCASTGGVCACDCKATCNNERAGNINLVSYYVAPGVYDIEFTLDPKVYPRPITHIGFFVSDVKANINESFSIVQITEVIVPGLKVYRLTTLDNGTASNGVLINKVISFKIYF